MLLLRRSQTEHPGCQNCIQVSDNWLPCGCGQWERALLGVWLEQGSHMLPASWEAGHRPPSSQMLWASLWLKGISFRRRARWLLSTCSPALASLLVPKSRVPGLRQHWALLYCPSGMGHGGLKRTSGLPQPQPGHHDPMECSSREESRNQGKAMLCCACQVASIPGMAYLALPLPRGLLRATPRGPCQCPLPGCVCSGRGGEGGT